MGDMGDYWRDVTPGMKERSQAKRASNREQSATLLTQAGVPFETRNAGAHLIVNHGGVVCDFWPGTGLWQVRGGRQGRGVRNLLKAINVQGQRHEQP
jgi:hypothetical protein